MILALNGGGMRGALQVGALLEFPGSLLDTFKDGGVYGISVGAIIAAYIAFGFTPADLADIFEEWSDVPLTPLSIASLTKVYAAKGLDDGSVVRERMRRNFFSKKGLDFDTLRIRDALIPLRIVATDLTNVRLVLFGQSMHVWDAIRSTISLPKVFTPHVIYDRLFVDGGVMCSDISRCIPVEDHTRTFFLLTARSIPSVSFVEAIAACSSTRGSHDIKARYPSNTCLIVDDDTPTLDIWSSVEKVQVAVEKGRAAMRAFLHAHDDPVFLGPSAETKKCS